MLNFPTTSSVQGSSVVVRGGCSPTACYVVARFTMERTIICSAGVHCYAVCIWQKFNAFICVSHQLLRPVEQKLKLILVVEAIVVVNLIYA